MIEDDNLIPDSGAEVLADGKPSEATAQAHESGAVANKDEHASPDAGVKDEGDAGGDDAAGERKSKPGSAKLKEKVQRLEREIEDLRSRNAAPRSENVPKLEDFDFDIDKYEVAKAVYVAKQVAEQTKAQTAEERVGSLENERAAAIIGAHEARIAEAKERLGAEFEKVLANAGKIPATLDLNRAVLESDKSALLLHHLASRPQEVAELNQMSPVQLARRIGQIEARLSYPTARTQSNAPPPVGGLRGGSAPNFDPATASHEEMKKLFART